MFLTKLELQDLTNYKYYRKQIAWLRNRGYRYDIGANGQPKVLRSYVEQALGYNAKVLSRDIAPDFEIIKHI